MTEYSYAICVCNEHREINALLMHLQSFINKKDVSEIVVLVDTKNVTDEVKKVLKRYERHIKVFEREFDNNFATHKNFLNSKCSGKYIFNIDADEMPNFNVIRFFESLQNETFDVVYVPRINICPGSTEEFLKMHNFTANENGWINWPDYQGRIYQSGALWEGDVHEKVKGTNVKALNPDPALALIHVKTMEKQNRQNELYKSIQVPDQE